MMLLADCLACQWGDHDHHQEVIQAVTRGILGGAKCPCKGECRLDREERMERFAKSIGLPVTQPNPASSSTSSESTPTTGSGE